MTDRTEIQECTGTLEYLLSEGLVPGLLPKGVRKAIELLTSMDKELTSLRAAMATKHHIVTAEAEIENGYQVSVRAEFVIADPRRYFGEIRTDVMRFDDPGFLPYAARSLTKTCTDAWMRELEEMAHRELVKAQKALKAKP
ncbi:MAG: hypothetical protein IPO08_19775 [Xanthomonadales bacterium]|nr:hypothetical protein [Xanthomonadales bacterium]